jgi:hypothetical protein
LLRPPSCATLPLLFTMKKAGSILAFIILASALPLRAQEKPASAAPAAATPAPTVPAGTGKIYVPTELEILRPMKGQKITVEGVILKQGESKTATVRYLNFTDDYKKSAALVFMVSKGGGDFTKEKLTNFVGKKYQVTGVLGEFNGNLQIEIAAFDQLKLVP